MCAEHTLSIFYQSSVFRIRRGCGCKLKWSLIGELSSYNQSNQSTFVWCKRVETSSWKAFIWPAAPVGVLLLGDCFAVRIGGFWRFKVCRCFFLFFSHPNQKRFQVCLFHSSGFFSWLLPDKLRLSAHQLPKFVPTLPPTNSCDLNTSKGFLRTRFLLPGVQGLIFMLNSHLRLVLGTWFSLRLFAAFLVIRSFPLASSEVRVDINRKKHFLSGIARMRGGGGLPMPKFFGPLFRSAFLVNKKSLFLQKCQCIELLTVF